MNASDDEKLFGSLYIFIVYIIFVTSLASDTSYPVDKRPGIGVEACKEIQDPILPSE